MTDINESKDSRSKKYFKWLIVILTGIIILDGYGTVLPLGLPSVIANEFLSAFSTEEQDSILALTASITTAGMYFLFFNQYFADKFGRKRMLLVTVLGMVIAALGLFLSINYFMFVFFTFVMNFFVSSDMWLIYANEESPPDKRAKNSNIILTGGIIGPVAMVLMRAIFITDLNPNWRAMTLFQLILGIPLFFIVLFKVKETSKYKMMKENNIKIEKRPIKEDFKAFSRMNERRSFIAILIICFISGISLTWPLMFEKYVSDAGTLSQDQITLLFLFAAFFGMVAYIVNGLLADRIGRKPLFFLWAILTPISIWTWVFGALNAEYAFVLVLIGFLVSHICSNGMTGMIRLLTIETLPTDIRATGIGVRTLFSTLGGSIGLFLSSQVILIITLGPTFVVFSFGSFILVPIALLFIKETKGIKLETIK
ncbi:MAG: MFS transporter [archaeon]|nr:MFS transporter [archaeon]